MEPDDDAYAVALDVLDALRGAGIPCALGGAHALGLWGVPRGTTDADIGTFAPPEDNERLVDTLRAAGVSLERDRALERARAGAGPSLIECKTYRWRGHFEGDACVYRDDQELADWVKKDPLQRFENKLLADGLLDDAKVESIRQEVARELDAAVAFAEQSPLPEAAEVLEDVYA